VFAAFVLLLLQGDLPTLDYEDAPLYDAASVTQTVDTW
jgi:hypothetical protein